MKELSQARETLAAEKLCLDVNVATAMNEQQLSCKALNVERASSGGSRGAGR
jgi:hypothetical protein